jgi:hypothetical protein
MNHTGLITWMDCWLAMDIALASLRFFYVSLLQHAAALGTLLVNSLLPQNADKIIHFCEL